LPEDTGIAVETGRLAFSEDHEALQAKTGATVVPRFHKPNETAALIAFNRLTGRASWLANLSRHKRSMPKWAMSSVERGHR